MPRNMLFSNDVKLWGEICEDKRNIIGEDVLRTLIRGAVKQEEPKLKLPVTDDEEDEYYTLPSHLTKQNEYVLHTIKLNEHAKLVEYLIECIEGGSTEFAPCPPVPVIPGVENDEKLDIKFNFQVNQTLEHSGTENLMGKPIKTEDDKNQVQYNFALGQGPELPMLDLENVNKMLQKSVLVSLAETGFTKANRASVNVLIDVVRYILTKTCRLLHMFSQEDVMRGKTLYKDPLEKVLQLLGMTGIRDVITYYQKNVIGKRDAALKRSLSLVDHYNTMVNKLKVQAAIEADEPNVNDNNPSGVNVQDIKKQQEPGFQMLFDFAAEPQAGSSTSQDFNSRSITKQIITKRISSNMLQNRAKKTKTETAERL